MKKVFLALAAVALLVTACNKAPEAKIKVYGWQYNRRDLTSRF
jgi:hypothetical protein